METELPPERPGLLTALAVLNFIIGALAVFSAFGLAVMPFVLGNLPADASGQISDAQRAQIDAMMEAGTGLLMTLAVVSLISAILLITSGIGYLKLKKFLGRTLGNAYAVLSLISTGGSFFLLPAALGGGSFGFGTILGLAYPVLTLILLNVVWKDKFVN